MEKSLHFAKIVATPTETAWSQAYNEGSVFAVLSLTKTKDIEPESLTTIGKEILNIFRSEFFGLEEKNLAGFRTVLKKSTEHVPPSILISFVVAFNKDDLLYLLLVGGGSVLIKRGDQTGTLLEETTPEPSFEIKNASGVLESGDCIILQTQEFSTHLSKDTLKESLSLDLPNDIAESLSPKIHNSEQGASAALILSYHGVPSHTIKENEEKDDDDASFSSHTPPHPIKDDTPTHPHEKDEEKEETEEDIQEEFEERPYKKRFSLPPIPLPKRTIILIAGILLLSGILGGSIYFTKTNQETARAKETFDKIFTAATQEFEAGQGLLSLNKPLARDSFLKAQATLQDADATVKEGSPEEKKLAELKKKIEEQLAATSDAQSVTATPITDDLSPLLTTKRDTKGSISLTEDDNFIYSLSSNEVATIDKGNKEKDVLITNDSDWEKAVSIGYYLGNIYILDTNEGILKFVQSGNSYSKSNYFKSATPDLSTATAMTIDGSIYVLFADGTINKYTKGVADSFKLTGLTTPLSSPTNIRTTADFTNIYVLDPSHSRVVVLDKNGAFIKELISTVLKDAQDFQIDADEKTMYVLAKTKLYSLPLE